ncbi:hypothetical protein BDE02_01G026800 [Populus trichocarpa]|nr:hypothetical protein BDE02_01G026800 [Populus trichocarpa]
MRSIFPLEKKKKRKDTCKIMAKKDAVMIPASGS